MEVSEVMAFLVVREDIQVNWKKLSFSMEVFAGNTSIEETEN